MTQWQEQEAGWSCCIHTQEAEDEQEVGQGHKASRPTPIDLLPPENFNLLNIPQLPYTVPSPGDPLFKHVSIQSITKVNNKQGIITHYLHII